MSSPPPPSPPKQVAPRPSAPKKPASSGLFVPKNIIRRAQGTPLRAGALPSRQPSLPLLSESTNPVDINAARPTETGAVPEAELPLSRSPALPPVVPSIPPPHPAPATMASDSGASGYQQPDTVESLKHANEDYYVKLTARDAEIDDLKRDLAFRKDVEKATNKRVANLEAEVAQWHQDRIDLNKRLGEAQRDAIAAKKETDEHIKKNRDLQSVFTTTQSDLDDRSQALHKAQDDLDSATNVVNSLQLQLATFNQQTTGLVEKASYYDNATDFVQEINRIVEPTFAEMGWELNPANIIEHFDNINKQYQQPQMQRNLSGTSLNSDSGEAPKISRPKTGNRKISIADELRSDDEMDIDGADDLPETDAELVAKLHTAHQRIAELESERAQIRTQISQAEATRTDSDSKAPGHAAELSSLREQVIRLNTESQNYRQQIAILEAQTKQDSVKITTLEGQTKQDIAKITSLESEKAGLAEKVASLQSSTSRATKPDTQSKISSENVMLKDEVKKLTEKNEALQNKMTSTEGISAQLKALQKKEKDELKQRSDEKETHVVQIKALETQIAALTKQNENSPEPAKPSTAQDAAEIQKLEARIAELEGHGKEHTRQLGMSETAKSTMKMDYEREIELINKSKKALAAEKETAQKNAAAKIKELQTALAKSTFNTNSTQPAPIIRYVTKRRELDFFHWWYEAPEWLHLLFYALIISLLFANASSWFISHAWMMANDAVLEHIRTMRFFETPPVVHSWVESLVGLHSGSLG
ncbi:unnamed protein product [Zymoseptoria tritici ST99CH_3D1]|nr:unnamed protein product [Zymoseptoria tritici ST99CH_3D1]